MVGRASTSMLWGIVADKYGRKPVILISIFSVLVDSIFLVLVWENNFCYLFPHLIYCLLSSESFSTHSLV